MRETERAWDSNDHRSRTIHVARVHRRKHRWHHQLCGCYFHFQPVDLCLWDLNCEICSPVLHTCWSSVTSTPVHHRGPRRPRYKDPAAAAGRCWTVSCCVDAASNSTVCFSCPGSPASLYQPPPGKPTTSSPASNSHNQNGSRPSALPPSLQRCLWK